MHELAVTQSVLDIALEQAKNFNINKIIGANLVIGEMSRIVDECVRFYFDFLSKDTIASGAILSFEKIPVKTHCRDCDATSTWSGLDWRCPGCQGYNIEVIAGCELYGESIGVE
jgi:hydrogenase nickel incorporation protein HypA/HybF